MKKILFLFCVLLLIFALTGCGGSGVLEPEEELKIDDEIVENIDNDFILITNVSRSLEPRKMRVGDEFYGLVLHSFMREDSGTVVANFSGELTLRGYISISADFRNVFVPWGIYLDTLPNLVYARKGVFYVQDTEDLYLLMPGISTGDATARIGNISVIVNEGDSQILADILEIIDHVTRRPPQNQPVEFVEEHQTDVPNFWMRGAWQEAYAALLREYAALWRGNPGNFILHDVIGNGTPALIVRDRAHFTRYFAAYIFQNGEVVALEANYFYDYATMFFPAWNWGIWMLSNEGVWDARALLIIEDGRLIPQQSFRRGEGAEGIWWQLNGEHITEEQFDAWSRSMFERSWQAIWGHEINEANIQNIVLAHYLAPVNLQISFVAEEDLGGLECPNKFAFRQWEGTPWILIQTDTPLADFEFINIIWHFWEEQGFIVYFVGSTVHAAGYVNPENPFAVRWGGHDGTLPNHGIAFTDPDGVRRYFALQASMADYGDPLFIWEITIAPQLLQENLPDWIRE